MQQNKIGSTCVMKYRGKQWPVVLCDDETPPAKFTQTKPNGYVLPGILLGKRIYVWVAGNNLEKFDSKKTYIDGRPFETDDVLDIDSEEDKLEKLRRMAFIRDAIQFNSPEFWKRCIEQRSAVRKSEREKNKRQREDDDDEIEVLRMRRRSSSSTTSPKRSRNSRSRSNRLPGLRPTPRKGNVGVDTSRTSPPEIQWERDTDEEDLFVRRSKSESDPFISNAEDNKREKNRTSVRNSPPDDDFCTIFVGPDQVPFLARKEGVGECDFLSDQVVFTEKLKSHIDLSEDTNVKPNEFEPVAEYLQKGEFTPRLIGSDNRLRLEGTVLSEEKAKAAEKISKLYLTAAKIKFGTLQQLCINKLRVLYPLSPKTLLLVLMVMMKADAAAHGCDAEQEMKDWLVDHVAEFFWAVVETEGFTFARLMGPNSDFKQRILEKLAQNPRIGVGVG